MGKEENAFSRQWTLSAPFTGWHVDEKSSSWSRSIFSLLSLSLFISFYSYETRHTMSTRQDSPDALYIVAIKESYDSFRRYAGRQVGLIAHRYQNDLLNLSWISSFSYSLLFSSFSFSSIPCLWRERLSTART